MATPIPPPQYWYVGGDTSRAFSAAVGDYVLSSDPTFQGWLAAGNWPWRVPDEATVGTYIANISGTRPVAANVLAAYQTAKANALDQAIFKVLFNHENRIRTLESRASVTAQQFITAISALL